LEFVSFFSGKKFSQNSFKIFFKIFYSAIISPEGISSTIISPLKEEHNK